MTSTYAAAVSEHDRLRVALTAENTRHEQAKRRLVAALAEAERVIGLHEGLGERVADAYLVARDLIAVEWARSGLYRDGERTRTLEVASCFRDAIEDLRHDASGLRRHYYGVKQYDRWPSQRSDHEYGFGPAHGSIWFRIGLRKPRRDLTEDERRACICWLRAVQANPNGTLGD